MTIFINGRQFEVDANELSREQIIILYFGDFYELNSETIVGCNLLLPNSFHRLQENEGVQLTPGLSFQVSMQKWF